MIKCRTRRQNTVQNRLTSQRKHLFKTIQINIGGAGLVIINSVFDSKHVFFAVSQRETKPLTTVYGTFVFFQHIQSTTSNAEAHTQ